MGAEHGLERRRDRRLRPPPRRGAGSGSSVNDACSELNRPTQAMKRGAERAGLVVRDRQPQLGPARHDPAMAGYIGFGDQSGAKQSTLQTYLQDAASTGADHRRLLRASGCWSRTAAPPASRRCGPTRQRAHARVTVRAPRVVVAAGALESPALLLRSGIGGPAAGQLPAAAPVLGDVRRLRRGHAGLVGRAARGPRRRVRRRSRTATAS